TGGDVGGTRLVTRRREPRRESRRDAAAIINDADERMSWSSFDSLDVRVDDQDFADIVDTTCRPPRGPHSSLRTTTASSSAGHIHAPRSAPGYFSSSPRPVSPSVPSPRPPAPAPPTATTATSAAFHNHGMALDWRTSGGGGGAGRGGEKRAGSTVDHASGSSSSKATGDVAEVSLISNGHDGGGGDGPGGTDRKRSGRGSGIFTPQMGGGSSFFGG
ncbi:unnamed protein product, partial [Sphacelaria rigidula]